MEFFSPVETFEGFQIQYYGITQNEGQSGCGLSMSNEQEVVTINFDLTYAEQFSEVPTFTLLKDVVLEYPSETGVLYQNTDALFSDLINKFREGRVLDLCEHSKRIYHHEGVYNELFGTVKECKYYFLNVGDIFLHVLAEKVLIIRGASANIFTEYMKVIDI